MNSFATRDAALGDVARVPPGPEPKLLADSLEPVPWPARPQLEWAPPGHGDVYRALGASGLLDALIDDGYERRFLSNADNLAAVPDERIAGWMAATGAPFVSEQVLRTAADRKGGHIARRRADGRLILRETAQTPPAERDHLGRHPSRLHPNNLWVDLRALRDLLDAGDGVPDLPVIANAKTVDPADPSTPAVLQLETAMGAAIGAVRGRAGGARPARALRPGEDHGRPARPALRRLRARRRPMSRAPWSTRRSSPSTRATTAASTTSSALPARRAVAARGDELHRARRRDVRRPGSRRARRRGGRGVTVTAFAPGRANLIGEHTDYNGGLALPFAIEEGVTVTAAPIDGEDLVVRADDLGEDDRFAAADPPRGAEGWRAFVHGVAAELGGVAASEVTISSTLASGAGLSSSAALTVALALALGADASDRVALAQLCSRVERDWAGANTGLLDQLASLCGEAGHALRIDFRTLDITPVPLSWATTGSSCSTPASSTISPPPATTNGAPSARRPRAGSASRR